MSLGLGALAIDGWTEASEALAMADRCHRPEHPEGDSDPRIAGFAEEPPEPATDPITSMGLLHLHGYGLAAGPTQDDPEIRAAFERWLSHGERFDADAAGWQRDRYREAVTGILRDQGPQQARALADRLIARGRLAPADVASILLMGLTHRFRTLVEHDPDRLAE